MANPDSPDLSRRPAEILRDILARVGGASVERAGLAAAALAEILGRAERALRDGEPNGQGVEALARFAQGIALAMGDVHAGADRFPNYAAGHRSSDAEEKRIAAAVQQREEAEAALLRCSALAESLLRDLAGYDDLVRDFNQALGEWANSAENMMNSDASDSRRLVYAATALAYRSALGRLLGFLAERRAPQRSAAPAG